MVTALYPLEFIAREVVGDHAQVRNLAVPGAEPHDLALQPSQVAALTRATTVFYVAGFQPELDKVVANQDPKHAVNALDLVARATNQNPDSDLDPHFWLDPDLTTSVVTGFAEQMQAADPANSAAYAANATALNQRLQALDAEYREELSNCRLTSIVVSHNAFSYLADRYGLSVHSIAGLAPDAEPSPKQLHELSELIRQKGITTIFYEPLASRDPAASLARETSTDLAVLDPIEGKPRQGAADYFDLMQANLSALRKANQCQ